MDKKEKPEKQVIDPTKLPCYKCKWRYSYVCPQCEWNKDGKHKVY